MERKYKRASFYFNPQTQEITVKTFTKEGDGQSFIDDDGETLVLTGKLTLNKVYAGSLQRFIFSLAQKGLLGKKVKNENNT